MRSTTKLILLLTLIFTSCGPAYRILLGVDSKPRFLIDQEDNIKQQARVGVNGEFLFTMDTNTYYDTVLALHKSKFKIHKSQFPSDSIGLKKISGVTKDDMQPVQFRVYDKTGSEIFKIVNCYVDILPIDWNYKNCFDTFPPQINDSGLNTHEFNIDLILNSLVEKVEFEELPQSEYYAVVIWNSFMIRPSKRLIEQIDDSYGLNNPDMTYLFVNNHNAVLWRLMDAEQKLDVQKEISKNNALQQAL